MTDPFLPRVHLAACELRLRAKNLMGDPPSSHYPPLRVIVLLNAAKILDQVLAQEQPCPPPPNS